MTEEGRGVDEIDVKEVIIERAYTATDLLVDTVVLTIPARLTSSTLDLLCAKVPLGDFGLLHCKRVRKIPDDSSQVQMLLCPSYHLSSLTAEGKHVYDTHPHTILPIPKVAPELTKEFQDWSIYWPLNFHPGERDRQQVKGLTKEDLAAIQQHTMTLLQDDQCVKKKLSDLTTSSEGKVGLCGGVVVNPFSNTVVCTSSEAIAFLEALHAGYHFIQHPILTPTMLCIDHVAHISRRVAIGKERLPEGDYLCTGLDLYLMEEPDLMSSMALVHSRIRRVFFVHPNNDAGALLSGNGHIHSLKALNHHYRVFQLLNIPPFSSGSSSSSSSV